jgi:hypothetical protein
VAHHSDADFLSHCAGAAHARSVAAFQRGMAEGARVAGEFTARVFAAPPPSNGVPPSRFSLPPSLSPAELSTLTREQRFLFDIYNRESTIAQANEMQRSANSDEWDSFLDAISGGIATIRRYSQRVSYRTDFRVSAAAYLNQALNPLAATAAAAAAAAAATTAASPSSDRYTGDSDSEPDEPPFDPHTANLPPFFVATTTRSARNTRGGRAAHATAAAARAATAGAAAASSSSAADWSAVIAAAELAEAAEGSDDGDNASDDEYGADDDYYAYDQSSW